MLLENHNCPKNESHLHYELKQIAKYILKSKGYNLVGEEIEIGYCKYLNDFNQFNEHKHSKCKIDVVGLSLKGAFNSYFKKGGSELIHNEPVFKSMGFESKVSLADFKNGFNTKCEKTYIITVKGTIPLDLIPKNIGLYEVDIDNYEISSYCGKFEFKGIEEVVKPRINLDPIFVDRSKPSVNKEYQTFCKDVLRGIAYRRSIDDLYKFNEININVKRKRRR